MGRFNILDNFMLSQGLFDNSVESVYTVHDVDNLSDHEPLFLVIQLVIDPITVTKRECLMIRLRGTRRTRTSLALIRLP